MLLFTIVCNGTRIRTEIGDMAHLDLSSNNEYEGRKPFAAMNTTAKAIINMWCIIYVTDTCPSLIQNIIIFVQDQI